MERKQIFLISGILEVKIRREWKPFKFEGVVSKGNSIEEIKENISFYRGGLKRLKKYKDKEHRFKNIKKEVELGLTNDFYPVWKN
jgi:chromosome segregation ATPase